MTLEIIDGNEFYVYHKKYYMILYVNGLNSFVIEYSENKEDAQKNLLEDTDLFSIFQEESKIIDEIEQWFIKYYINENP